MTIFLNNLPTTLPSDLMTVEDIVNWKKIQAQGTAIAINDKLIKQDQWKVTQIKEFDQVTVITAAYGG